jgi:hypothetical protein
MYGLSQSMSLPGFQLVELTSFIWVAIRITGLSPFEFRQR